MSRSPSTPSRAKFAQPAANGNRRISSGSANFAATMRIVATLAGFASVVSRVRMTETPRRSRG
jgi:hypothetical protein